LFEILAAIETRARTNFDLLVTDPEEMFTVVGIVKVGLDLPRADDN